MAGSSDDATDDAPHSGPPSGTIRTSGLRPRKASGPNPRLILFASKEEEIVTHFESLMPDGVRVLRLDDVFSLLESLRGQTDEPTLIVDQRHGLFRVETLGAISSALPEGARVLLWGSSDEEMEAATALGQGRVFHRAEASASAEDLAWMCRPGTRSDIPPAPARPRLLLIDDDDAYARSVARLLKTAGFDIVVERDPHAALDLCRDGEIVAALVDQHMPLMDGSSFASLVRLSMGDDAPRIIMVTGGSSAAVDGALFDAILHKPVGPARLLGILAELLPSEES